MDRVAVGSPGRERELWLDELAEAIDRAQLIAWQLGVVGDSSTEALDVYLRLDAAREEVSRLRGGGWRSQRNEIYL